MENQNQKPPQQEDGEEEQEEETFTCEICIEPVNRKFKNSNKCDHPFCTDCIQKYIKLKVQENVSDIKCPAINCNHSLEILSCRTKITNQVFNKWCDVLCESLVLGYSRVYCPNTECSELILDQCGDEFGGRLKRCVCPKCLKRFCFRCKVPWHADDNSCKETMDENDGAFYRVYKKNKWKRCHCIERVDGCNQVICRCGVVFDYNNSRKVNCDEECGLCHYIILFLTFGWCILFTLFTWSLMREK